MPYTGLRLPTRDDWHAPDMEDVFRAASPHPIVRLGLRKAALLASLELQRIRGERMAVKER
jgi:hypothetical protein